LAQSGHASRAQRCPQLVPQKQVFDFKPAPRPEQVGDKPHKQMKERKHHVDMSIKWKFYKTILRYSKGIDEPIVEPQVPMMYDLSSDPQEIYNLFDTVQTNGWVVPTPGYDFQEGQLSVIACASRS
jgi:hypothetical protein